MGGCQGDLFASLCLASLEVSWVLDEARLLWAIGARSKTNVFPVVQHEMGGTKMLFFLLGDDPNLASGSARGRKDGTKEK